MKKKLFLVALAAASSAIFGAETAVGETWFCAVNAKLGGAQIQEFRVEGNKVREMTSDKSLKGDFKWGKGEFLGTEYNTLHNDKNSLIAVNYFSGLNSQNQLEVSVMSIIITKGNGNLLDTTIVAHLPAPNEIETVYGSCTNNHE